MKTRTIIILGVVATLAIVIPMIFVQKNQDLPENNALCITHILVKTKSNTDRGEFSKDVLEEMRLIDSRFVYEGRDIQVTNMGDDNLRVSLDGLWSPDGSGARLIESIEKMDSVVYVLDQGENRLVLECQ